jgi:hypothetical protein
LELRGLVGLALMIVKRLTFDWWDITDGAVETSVVPLMWVIVSRPYRM